MSILTYNGVTLPYAFATRFNQEAVYDNVAGIDRVYTRFDIQVQTVVNSNYLTTMYPSLTVGGNPSTYNPAEIMKVIRTELLQPRKVLYFFVNEENLIPNTTGGSGTVDAKNGPQPQSCNISQLTNQTFLLVYHIIAHYWECNDISVLSTSVDVTNVQDGSNVLSNRWSETVDIDNCDFSKRTREGTYVIRSDNKAGFIADFFREQMAVVGVPSGFLRESSRYAVTPDGLGLHYQVVDKEVFKNPPEPAFHAEGEYVETATRRGGPMRRAEARVRLRGSKGTNQALLIQTAVGVAASKVIRNTQSFQFALLDSASVRINMYENEVEANVAGLLRPSTNLTGVARYQSIWGFDFSGMTFTPGSDNVNYTPPYVVRGTASLLLQAAAYYDPCLNATLNRQTSQMTTGIPPGTAGKFNELTTSTLGGSPGFPGTAELTGGQSLPPVVITTAPPITPDSGNANYLQLGTPPESVWTDFEIHGHYEKDRHIYMMPVASPSQLSTHGTQFCQLAKPTLLWIADWTASKFNEQPEIPDPELLDPPLGNWVLMDDWYEPVSLSLAPDGITPLYRISGTYVYGCVNPAAIAVNDIIFGRPPWMLDVYDRTMPAAKLQPDLID